MLVCIGFTNTGSYLSHEAEVNERLCVHEEKKGRNGKATLNRRWKECDGLYNDVRLFPPTIDYSIYTDIYTDIYRYTKSLSPKRR